MNEVLETVNGFTLQCEYANIIECYMQIATSHKKSIHLLVQKGMNYSAFALVRPLYDAILRGLYIN